MHLRDKTECKCRQFIVRRASILTIACLVGSMLH